MVHWQSLSAMSLIIICWEIITKEISTEILKRMNYGFKETCQEICEDKKKLAIPKKSPGPCQEMA